MSSFQYCRLARSSQLGKEEEEREEKSGKKEQKHDAQKCLPRTLNRSHPSFPEALARMAGPFQSW